MKTNNTRQWLMVIAVAAIVTGSSCKKEQAVADNAGGDVATASLTAMMAEKGANPDDIMLSVPQTEAMGGYVYTESNDAAKNSILIYRQEADGMLSYLSSVASGGAGNDKGLGSQGAVVLNEWHSLLFAVNAGDNSVSSFYVHSDGSLTLSHTVSSGGITPISVTVHGNLLYVVNSGSDNISGYQVEEDGMLMPINGSVQMLSSTGSGPAEIKFHPEGHVLFVTEKNTNKIGSFTLSESGAANAGTFASSVGTTPFGFEFAGTKHFMIVSNAAGGAANAGSCTSYNAGASGNISDINGAVPDHQSAPCWVAPTYHGRYAYTTNTASNNISAYYVSPVGRLYLIPFAKVDAGAGPIDIVVSTDNRYVYSLNSVAHTIGEYKRKPLGTISSTGEIMDLPPYAAGLACY